MFRRSPARRGPASLAARASACRERSRGQSLVEFALVLPILLFLTLIALDFGRVYLGYINLQNMARIAANFAANNSSAWDAIPNAKDAKLKIQYYNQIIADAQAINCRLQDANNDGTINADDFAPTFTDRNGNGSTTDLGDSGTVQIGCNFSVITPGIAAIVGNSVKVAAASSFPVKTGMTASGNGAGAGGSAPNAAFSGNGVITSVAAPASINGVAPFAVEFRDTSGGNPSSWTWTFPDDGTVLHVQDPLVHTFTAAGTYIVTMQATNLYGSSTASMGVTVVDTSTVNFEADATDISAGTTVHFTDKSTSGGTAWSWNFGAGQGTGTGQTPSHQYNSTGTYTVSLTVTYPSPTGPLTATKIGYIKVQVGNCTVPSFTGVKFNDAQALFNGAPYNFTGVVIRGPGAPNGNFTINQQNLTYPGVAPCNSDVTVNRK